MKGLFTAVTRGIYPKIPSQYSSDLAAMIDALLKVDPKKRPSTEQILHMPVYIAKYNEHREEFCSTTDSNDGLLGTIRVPKNLSLLA